MTMRALLVAVFAVVFVAGSQLLTSTVLMYALFLALCRLEDSYRSPDSPRPTSPVCAEANPPPISN